MSKIISWVMLNGASVLGVTQGLLKVLKELCTAIVNLLSIFMDDDKVEERVGKVRSILNIVDEWIEKIKAALI